MKALGIAIDGGRYIRLDLACGAAPRTLRLRTLKAGQDKARLDFYKFKAGRPILLAGAERRVSGFIRTGAAEAPETPVVFNLRVEHRSRHRWVFSVRQRNRVIDEFTVRTGIPLWPFLLLGFVAVVLVLGFWVSPFLRGEKGTVAVADGGVESVADVADEGKSVSGQSGVGSSGSAEPSEASAAKGVRDSLAVEPLPPVLLPPLPPLYFEPDSAALTSTAKSELLRIIELLDADAVLDIGGHCADFGSERGREKLSLARAQVVADFLKARMPSLKVGRIVGYGVSRPKTRDPERQELNRRVEITRVGEEDQ